MNHLDLKNKLNVKNVPIFKYVYFLPNHDLQWIKNVLSKLCVKNVSTYNLLVVGYYYGTIVKTMFPNINVTVIDADPLAILSNAFAVWLNSDLRMKFKNISRVLFLDFYRLNHKYRLPKAKLSYDRYNQSLTLFQKFINKRIIGGKRLNKCSITHLFNTIYRIEFDDKNIFINRVPKGFCNDIIQYPLEKKLLPDKVIIGNLIKIKTNERYNAIITTNSIDFSKNKSKFLDKIRDLLLVYGLAEISSYNTKTNKMLHSICNNKKKFLGTSTFFDTTNKNSMTYFRKPIYLGRITHIFQH
ncbi:MAG: hypothetical protein PHD96_01460 [Candidatus Pacebacteria bacterium]|nr:hypothetical protein [Candidatus Paceibacterota bacterium]